MKIIKVYIQLIAFPYCVVIWHEVLASHSVGVLCSYSVLLLFYFFKSC